MIWAFIDNSRGHDHSGWVKAGWALLMLPLLGMLIYLIVRPADAQVGHQETSGSDLGS